MKFLVDAQLPRKITAWLADGGHDARHTLDLPDGNRTKDAELIAIAESEQRIVVSKDADFVDSHLLNDRPQKLLLVSTGNIHNQELEALVKAALSDLVREFQVHSFIELSQTGLIARD